MRAAMRSLRRIIRLGRSGCARLLGAVALGVLAAGAAVVLAGTSAWLIARAAEHPPVLHLMVAIVAVRAAGIGRGVFRYSERLLSHDASFRVLTDLRVAVVTRVERLLPGTRALGNPGRMLEHVADGGDEFLCACLVKSIQRELRHSKISHASSASARCSACQCFAISRRVATQTPSCSSM